MVPVGTVVSFRYGNLGKVVATKECWRYEGEQILHNVRYLDSDGALKKCPRCGDNCDFSCPIVSRNLWHEDMHVIEGDELKALAEFYPKLL